MNKFLMLPESRMALKYDDTIMELVVAENFNEIVLFTIQNLSNQAIKLQYYNGGVIKWEDAPNTATDITETAGLTIIDITPVI